MIKRFVFFQALFNPASGTNFNELEYELVSSYVDRSGMSSLNKLWPEDFVSLDMQGALTQGAFGYEEYDWPCSATMTASYGYSLGHCSRGSDSSSYIYNWCAVSEDESRIYFHVTEYRGPNCTETPLYNHTFWDNNACDPVNSRKPICTSSMRGWEAYEFNQHIEIMNNLQCVGDVNYWKTENKDCLDFCYISEYSQTVRGRCDSYPNGWDDNYCFHADSIINYKGVEYTYLELAAGKEPECTVPHSPLARGVVISTSCNRTARVTDTHLMSTPDGFRMAYSLKRGDALFGGFDDAGICEVLSVEKEKSEQEYFGLNCIHSEVLTSGLRASTFGDFHTLPSWYMSYVGGLLGAEATSRVGGYVAGWFFGST